jgi:class 3 adenylate cyclase
MTGNAPSAEQATNSAAQSVSHEDRAERRQVTVMFSDLVGSTALSARLDPRICGKSSQPIRRRSKRP